jgi:hypothetical protein
MNIRISIKTIIVAVLVLAVVFFVYRTEARSKALGMNTQAIVNLLVYNLQQGTIKQVPQAQPQAQPAPAATPAPAPEKKEPAKKAEK